MLLLFSAYLIPVSVCLNTATFNCGSNNYLIWDIYREEINIFTYILDQTSMVGNRYFTNNFALNFYVELIFKNSSLLYSTLTINGTHLNPRLRIECSRSGQQLLDFQSKLISQFEMNT